MARSRVLSFQIMEHHGGQASAAAVVKIIVVFKKSLSRPRAFFTKKNHLLSRTFCATYDNMWYDLVFHFKKLLTILPYLER